MCSDPAYAIAVERVDDVDEAVCVVEVVAPQRPQLFLSAHVPHCEYHIFVLYLLHIKTCAWRGGWWVWLVSKMGQVRGSRADRGAGRVGAAGQGRQQHPQ